MNNLEALKQKYAEMGAEIEGQIRARYAIDTVGADNIAWAARVLAGGSIER